jgi:PAS domain-containing protein/GGDEF domain-containing protein
MTRTTSANGNWQDALKLSLLDDHFMKVGELIAALMEVPISLLSIIDGDYVILHSSSEGLSRRIVCPISLASDPIRRGETVAIQRHEDPVSMDELELDERIQSSLKAPIVLDGQTMAVLCVMDYNVRYWTERDRIFLQNFAQLMSTEFALRRAAVKLQFESNLVETVVESMQDEVIITNLQGNYLRSNAAARNRFGSMRYDAEDPFPADFRWYDESGRQLAISELPLARTLATHELVRQDLLLKTDDDPTGSWMSTQSNPILGSTGTVMGALLVTRDITYGRNRQSEIANTELEDPDTQLPTLCGFHLLTQQLLATVRRERTSFSVIVLELTESSQAAEDFEIAELVKAMKSTLRASDVVARVHSRRFAVVAKDTSFEPLIERLQRALVARKATKARDLQLNKATYHFEHSKSSSALQPSDLLHTCFAGLKHWKF